MARPHPLLPVALLCLGACADPRGEFEAFTERRGTDPIAEAGPSCAPAAAADISGTFYFLIAPTPIDKTIPIVFSAELTATESPRTLGMVVTPLLAADRATPITAEGGSASLDLGTFPIDDGGFYEAPLPLLRVPGEANPLTGREIAAQVTLRGQFCTPESAATPEGGAEGGAPPGPPTFYCGDVVGDVTEPLVLPLAGSFYTLERMVGGVPPDPIKVDCSGTPAGPIPTP